ncbi:hypothetical protein Bca101_080285 [Brassica carinata]
MEKSRRRKDRKTTSLDTSDQQSWPQLLTIDLMMDIFSRLSLKSIAICRCVSKQWTSLIGQSDFRDLRLTRSQARPRLLFACIQDKKVSFLSSPQPQSPDQISSTTPLNADYHMSFSFDHPLEDVSTSVSGFVCVSFSGHRLVNGRKFAVEESVICNPTTGQSLTIPRMNTKKRTGMIRFFGYDPVEKLHKVLGMICPSSSRRTMEHQVLTLASATTWRRTTECGIHCCISEHTHNICINGVFYYIEFVRDVSSGGPISDLMVICFDVRSDKFSFVKFPEGNHPWHVDFLELLDCNGKLAFVSSGSLYATSESIVMWVLQDPERHEWSRCVCILPPMWKDIVVDPKERLEIVGVNGGPNEFVMAPTYSSDPFHVYYCNFEKGTVTRVVIQGMGAFGNGRTNYVRTYLNHVEDVKLMKL